ncbi:hypothetical protein EG340_18065 [Chryseobacterium indoltheticum]|uniref:Uncharacterized protein n=1 Tax=Chryseobacterium indoltheticum TaxID=254 RepID=A0A3G6N5P2_9FLAO|nr:hypothetical protein EG340_18065 [Chryseobacterium indoltheticum]
MKKIFNKAIEPANFVVIFLLFVISILLMYTYMDYKYNRIKNFIVFFYLLPGLLFFTVFSIYNLIRFKNSKNLSRKFLSLVPLVIIIIYFLYILIFIMTI